MKKAIKTLREAEDAVINAVAMREKARQDAAKAIFAEIKEQLKRTKRPVVFQSYAPPTVRYEKVFMRTDRKNNRTYEAVVRSVTLEMGASNSFSVKLWPEVDFGARYMVYKTAAAAIKRFVKEVKKA